MRIPDRVQPWKTLTVVVALMGKHGFYTGVIGLVHLPDRLGFEVLGFFAMQGVMQGQRHTQRKPGGLNTMLVGQLDAAENALSFNRCVSSLCW